MPFSPTPPSGPVTLSQNARTVLSKRYLTKDAAGKPTEQPEDMFWRVATVVAEADRRYGASDGAVNATSASGVGDDGASTSSVAMCPPACDVPPRDSGP